MPASATGLSPSTMQSADEPLVVVRKLRKDFPLRGGLLLRARRLVRAVNGIDLDIRQGESLALVGESGCGKSTLARLILRLLEPSAGTVHFAGEDIFRLEGRALKALRRQAQIIFQDPFGSLNPRMTVGSTLREVLRVHKLASGVEADRRIGELLDAVGLHGDDASKYPHEFSGGQRQRVGIARALAVEPEFIVADEPVSALDVSVRAQVLNLFADLQHRFHLTYLFISHDLSVVRHIADRVAVMYQGRIVELGAADAVFRTPQHPYTQVLLSAVPVADSEEPRVRIPMTGEISAAAAPRGGCPFFPHCPHTEKDEVCEAVDPPLRTVQTGALAACHKV